MKKFIAIVISALVISAELIVSMKASHINFLFNPNIDALSQVEVNVCYNGGVGSNQCSIEGGITIAGSGVSANCSVSCDPGYYACCGIRCTCIKY